MFILLKWEYVPQNTCNDVDMSDRKQHVVNASNGTLFEFIGDLSVSIYTRSQCCIVRYVNIKSKPVSTKHQSKYTITWQS